MEELYQKNAKIVYCYLLSFCHDELLAEELTQETFFQAMRSIERYDGTCKMSTWLCQIAKHTYYKFLQKRKHEVLTDMAEKEQIQEKSEGVNTERQVIAKVELIEVLKEMQTLPQVMREVIYLRITGELSFKEIGEIMGKSENWARVNFFRGKEMLMKRRKRYEGTTKNRNNGN